MTWQEFETCTKPALLSTDLQTYMSSKFLLIDSGIFGLVTRTAFGAEEKKRQLNCKIYCENYDVQSRFTLFHKRATIAFENVQCKLRDVRYWSEENRLFYIFNAVFTLNYLHQHQTLEKESLTVSLKLLLYVFKYLYCQSRCHNIEIFLQSNLHVLIYDVCKTKNSRCFLDILLIVLSQGNVLPQQQKHTHQITRCRPPAVCVHCRTGWVHGESCWILEFCHNQLCSSSQFPTLQINEQGQLLL